MKEHYENMYCEECEETTPHEVDFYSDVTTYKCAECGMTETELN